MNILIVLMGSLGDVTRGLTVACALKKQLAGARVYWLVEPACEKLVRCNASIDRVIVFKRTGGWQALVELREELRAVHFDLALDLQRHFKSGLFSFLSGARRRIGFHPAESKEFNWLFNNEYIGRKGEKHSKLEHYLEFLRFLGLKAEPPDFGLDDFSFEENLPQGLPGAGVVTVGVLLGSRWQTKDWPLQNYRELLELVRNKQPAWQVLLLGDKRQEREGAELAGVLDSERVLNLAGKTDLLQLMAVLKRCDCCLGPDSGPGHLAAALGTPYITLFGPTAPARVAPYGMQNLILNSKIACAPCQRRICPGLANLCMQLITAQSVYGKLSEVVSQGTLHTAIQ